MFNYIFNSHLPEQSLRVAIIEPNSHQGRQLADLIMTKRPKLKVMLLKDSEQVFNLMDGEINLDILFFDIEEEVNTENIALIKAISSQTRLIHWSDYQHPEVIELLHSLGVNSFCKKESDAEILLEAIDLAANYPQSLYIDRKLHQCLPPL